MSVTSGFFNSQNYDRGYDATQVSQIFDGVIEDGVYMKIGNRFNVVAAGNHSMNIIVGSGRAWFDHTWTLNDSDLVLTVDLSETVMDRIDAVVIKVDHTLSVRANSIEIVKGVPAANNPQKPDLINTSTVFYHVLAYIYVAADVTEITDANIENAVGTEQTPWVLAPVQNMEVDELIRQWRTQYAEAMVEDQDTFNGMLTDDTRAFNIWFNTIKEMFIDEDVATRLVGMISELNTKWEDFSKTGAFLDNILDEDENPIQDQYGDNIIGASVYVKYATYQELRVRVNDMDHKDDRHL